VEISHKELIRAINKVIDKIKKEKNYDKQDQQDSEENKSY
jgi:hypothetical protein